MAAYWIAHVNIHDPEQYQHYMDLAPAAFKRYHARFVARGGRAQTLEGQPFTKHVLIEFNDMESALACYHSEEYQLARKKRVSASEALITIIEGESGLVKTDV
ncbi:DUF1330 domain-containing protein [Salmonella enterica subsp. enterica serovar Muenchen]|nr:DUF1330 domain-containing protein [Salmonella enterica]EBU8846495.1 DUF1330 domain-containing protein [Salmonella enterica subsp. enterica serovar Muenchen]ECX6011968.1 DUF1330 domain-containing protein [Salmonella enterica subsp. enterica serovar Rubislaw]EBW2622236.1 DUF1330 domain-containing protein [Salmonella enterica subsp. enterica serovar Muenchen]EBW3354903.1 DUF1330 domain-containing protein [Salmonella enterica subsp. enterica serovar Muenchen]